jgi:hypothetical protein
MIIFRFSETKNKFKIMLPAKRLCRKINHFDCSLSV